MRIEQNRIEQKRKEKKRKEQKGKEWKMLYCPRLGKFKCSSRKQQEIQITRRIKDFRIERQTFLSDYRQAAAHLHQKPPGTTRNPNMWIVFLAFSDNISTNVLQMLHQHRPE